ncbi:MAG: hypothetical protein Q9220_003750 [cf. Caloplaca sp. 1 TL-2023]
MGAIDNPSGFQSQVFKILVGQSQEPFFVHAHALSRSKPLRQMITGAWKENQEKTIEWPEWDPRMAEKFIEWLYTDDYHCVYPAQIGIFKVISDAADISFGDIPTGSISEGEVIEGEGKAVAQPKAPKSEEPAAKKQKTGASTFLSVKEIVTSTGSAPKKLTQSEHFDLWMGHLSYKPEDLDYSTTFSTHVQLYLMGHQYLLDSLKLMARQRLGAVLVSIGRPTIGAPIINNILSLIREIYVGTGQGQDEEEPLRSLVTTFVATHFSTFKESNIERLATSHEECDRDFTADLLRKLMLRTEPFETQEGKAISYATPKPIMTEPSRLNHEFKCFKCHRPNIHHCGYGCPAFQPPQYGLLG